MGDAIGKTFELGDGILGGYSVDTILKDADIGEAMTSLVFCTSDYVGVVGGQTVLSSFGIDIDVVAGSVTDSKMGEEYIRERLGLAAANAHRNGDQLFFLCYGASPNLQPLAQNPALEFVEAL